MTDFKIVYTTGLKKRMLRDLKHSILSARRFVNKDDVIVIFTPPLDYSVIEEFKKYATVIVKEKNLTKPFKIHPWQENDYEGYYGDKLYVKDIDYPNVLFLDCDTIVYNDPTPLFEGDFDFGGASSDGIKNRWRTKQRVRQKLRYYFKIPPKNYFQIWNAGHLVFKNYSHQKIAEDWLKYFNEKEKLKKACRKSEDDQFSISIAFGMRPEFKVKRFYEDKIFKIGWYSNSYKDMDDNVIIVHGDDLAENLNMIDELSKVEEKILNEQ